MEDQIRDTLIELGYSVVDNGREFRARPIYRDSGNSSSLMVKKDNGFWIDYGSNSRGYLPELVQISLGLKDISEAKDWLKGRGYSTSKAKAANFSHIKECRIFPEEYVEVLEPDHSYWIDRGITKETIELFKGGVCDKGKMKNRYVFPIFNSKDKLIGYTGRHLHNKKPKWMHRGDKSYWKYPLQFNFKYIKNNKSVIIVESIGDMLSLWDAGIKNVMVAFGLDISKHIINTLIRIQADKIIISLNNGYENGNVGNEASEKQKGRLLKYFNSDQVKIELPSKNDFGEMSQNEIVSWLEERKLKNTFYLPQK